jgi:hypothetical protein
VRGDQRGNRATACSPSNGLVRGQASASPAPGDPECIGPREHLGQGCAHIRGQPALVEATNQGRPISRKVHLKVSYDLLVSTNRHAGGKNYERLKESLNRLVGTRIETNIATNGKRFSEGFGLTDFCRILGTENSCLLFLGVLCYNLRCNLLLCTVSRGKRNGSKPQKH